MDIAPDRRLPLALDAELRSTRARAGRVDYYVAGAGTPMLLIHSVNAAASACEMRPIFDRAVQSHRVFAIDLPGFGFSERSDRPYSVRLYTDAVHDMLDVIATEAGAMPVDAVALSLGAEFVARATIEAPRRLRSLALITPTGFRRGSERLRAPPGTTREIPGMHAALTVPLWSQALFELLVSKPSVRYFLGRTWGSKQIDEGLWHYCWLSAHQEGARHAPLAFLSGRLFGKDIRSVYEQLALPVWMPHGTRGDFGDFRGADWLAARPNWRVRPFDSGALPHFEHPDLFWERYGAFLADLRQGQDEWYIEPA